MRAYGRDVPAESRMGGAHPDEPRATRAGYSRHLATPMRRAFPDAMIPSDNCGPGTHFWSANRKKMKRRRGLPASAFEPLRRGLRHHRWGEPGGAAHK